MALSGGLAACGGGSSKTTMDMPDPEPMPTPQEMCEDDGGRWNADMTCTDSAGLAAEAEAATKAADTKLTAITTEAGTDGAGGLPTNTTATVSRDRDGTTVTVNDHMGTTADDEGDDDVTYVQNMMADLPDGTTMHVREADPDANGNIVTQIVMVSTNIKEPMAVMFADFEAADGSMPQELDANPATTGETDYQSLDIGADNLDMLATNGITATGASTVTLLAAVADDPQTMDDETVEAFSTDAMFNGAAGTLTCGGDANCTATLDADGEITAVSGGWIFTPADMVTVDQSDYDYLAYGFWLQKTEDSDGVVTYNNVETFVIPTGYTESTGTITGSASYSGGATGVYVHHVLSEGGGMIESSTAGHFTAVASLEATFGQPAAPDNNIPPSMLNSVTGTIEHFVLSGGEANDWTVALAGTVSDAGAFSDGTAKGGSGDGSLDVTFYGDADTLPAAAGGEFNADTRNGSVAGAFGVDKDDE